MSGIMLVSNVVLAASIAAVSPPRDMPSFCSIRKADGSSWRPSEDNARYVARTADVVVRARAVRTDSVALRPDDRPRHVVVFDLLEVIAADSAPRAFMTVGRLTEVDDFNPAPAPYPAVRPSGQRGSCFAEEYRRGGEFLLLLKRTADGLTPYWAALAPTNEQIRGASDPWVTWVREERRRAGRRDKT